MKSTFILSFCFIVAATMACQRKGCADPLANNYDKKVVKSDSTKCEYGEIDEAPCGEGIEFCMEYGNRKLEGEIELTEPSTGATRFTWESDLPGEYQTFEITVYGTETGDYSYGNTEEDGTFSAIYFSDTIGTANGIDGVLKLKTYSVANGITATFQIEMDDNTSVQKGNLYRAK